MTDIQALEADIKLGGAVARLYKNKDFKMVIQEMYLNGGAINLTKNINVVKDESKVISQIKARGELYRFLMDIEETANGANAALAQMQEQSNRGKA